MHTCRARAWKTLSSAAAKSGTCRSAALTLGGAHATPCSRSARSRFSIACTPCCSLSTPRRDWPSMEVAYTYRVPNCAGGTVPNKKGGGAVCLLCMPPALYAGVPQTESAL